MFGILSPCPARTPEALRPRWMGHFCGLCLALRDDAGHLARLSTNYDALTLSALVEAQTAEDDHATGHRDAGPCALRGMRRQRITTGAGPRLAATASLLLASAKLRDHVEDRDGIAARPGISGLTRMTADRYRTKAAALGDSIGLSVDRIYESIDRQKSIETSAGPDTSLLAVTAPAEEATAALFAHAAVISGKPDNIEPLHAAGKAFGRLAHLLDAVTDFDEDAERGAWNPLAATGTGLDTARGLARGALAEMRTALKAATFLDETMVQLLLDRYAAHAVSKAFSHTGVFHSSPDLPEEDPEKNRKQRTMRRGFWDGLCGATVVFASCQWCCASEYEGPWSGQSREGCLHKCDCDCPCDSCECNCCDCCNCCGNGDSGGDGGGDGGGCCDGCDCSCD